MFLPFPVLMFIEFRENASVENRQKSKTNVQGGNETIEITSMTETDGADMVIETIRCDKKVLFILQSPSNKVPVSHGKYIAGVITQ